jgi:biopolymer transport protein ExbB/TolQ
VLVLNRFLVLIMVLIMIVVIVVVIVVVVIIMRRFVFMLCNCISLLNALNHLIEALQQRSSLFLIASFNVKLRLKLAGKRLLESQFADLDMGSGVIGKK